MSRVGTHIDKYELKELLAVGGQAEVYRAVLSGAKNYSKTVAIKRILSATALGPDQTKYFEREAHLCALLNHPNLVQTFDFVQHEADLYLVMEFIHGKNLKEVDAHARQLGTPLSLEAILFVVSQACLGLDYAHQQTDEAGTPLHIVHRDISPHNIMLTYDGMTKVVDFGVAKASDAHHKTATGMFLGKLAYMSPEQVCVQSLDARTDIFSMGLVLYELLAGRRAYADENPTQLIDAARECRIPPLSELGIVIAPELQAILNRALAKQREDRYVSAGDMAEAIQQYASSLGTYTGVDLGFLLKSLYASEIEKDQIKSKSDIRSASVKIKKPRSAAPPLPKSSRSNEINWPVPLVLISLMLGSWAIWKQNTKSTAIQTIPVPIAALPKPPPSKPSPQREVAYSPEVIAARRESDFSTMAQIVWAQPKPWQQDIDPNGPDSIDFIIARWNYSPASKITFGYGDARHPIQRVAHPCLISTGRGCGPISTKGYAPFSIAVKAYPRPGIDADIYISPEDCNHMGNNARLEPDGTCYFTLPAGKHSVGIHFTRKE